MPERFTLPRTVTGSTWPNVMAALWERSSRGVVMDDEGGAAPRWTNREALAVVMALRRVAQRGVPAVVPVRGGGVRLESRQRSAVGRDGASGRGVPRRNRGSAARGS